MPGSLPRARLRLCLTEVFLPGDGAPSCDGGGSQGRDSALARHTLVMRALRAGQFEEGGKRLLELPPAEDATLAAWIAEDRAFLERSRDLPQKSHGSRRRSRRPCPASGGSTSGAGRTA
ncbi:MAG: hypothetical protein ACOX6T_02525 [Myxococcales bacterium]|jgi:hypothetical protein